MKAALGLNPVGPTENAEHQVTAVVNTGDDLWMHGLRICPDLDTCMYTLGGGIETARGWGRAGETWAVREELAAYGADPTWFGLGDRDIATHLVRTRMLRAGYPLSAVTEALCDRWQPGVRLLPMSDDRVETHVVVDLPGEDGGESERKAVHFQEWWVRYHAELPAHSIVPVGAEESKPAPGVLAAIAEADVVLLAPSNPVVSIGTVLAVPGIRDALRGGPAPVDRRCPPSSATGRCAAWPTPASPRSACPPPPRRSVATSAPAPTSETGILDGWLIHKTDTAEVPGVGCGRCRC